MMDLLLAVVVLGTLVFALVADILVCVAWIKGRIRQ
jgi:hypothetical protein